jgi:hypothetical protein
MNLRPHYFRLTLIFWCRGAHLKNCQFEPLTSNVIYCMQNAPNLFAFRMHSAPNLFAFRLLSPQISAKTLPQTTSPMKPKCLRFTKLAWDGFVDLNSLTRRWQHLPKHLLAEVIRSLMGRMCSTRSSSNCP